MNENNGLEVPPEESGSEAHASVDDAGLADVSGGIHDIHMNQGSVKELKPKPIPARPPQKPTS